MENKHNKQQEKSNPLGGQGKPSMQGHHPANRHSHESHEQGAMRPGSPYRGRPAHQGPGSRGSARREWKDML